MINKTYLIFQADEKGEILEREIETLLSGGNTREKSGVLENSQPELITSQTIEEEIKSMTNTEQIIFRQLPFVKSDKIYTRFENANLIFLILKTYWGISYS